MAEKEDSGMKLGDIFQDVWKTYEFLERCDQPTNSEEVQKKVAKAVKDGEKIVEMINVLGLFSDNESIEEVSSNEIRYLLMPALLAYFTSKSTTEERASAIKKSKVYYLDYLRLVKLYGVAEVNASRFKVEEIEEEKKTASQPSRPGMPDLALMEKQRKAKIARFKEQKALESKLQELEKAANLPNADDEAKRSYHITLVKSWVNKSEEELDSIEMELPVLEHMAKMKAESLNGTPKPEQNKPKEQRPKFQPFILTKDKMQAKVFGLGYPSIPTYSVEEWAEKQIAEGKLPDMGIPPASGDQPDEEAEAIKKEREAEKDDPDALQKARNWDDWKDDHRRGWGNRQNMG